MSRSGKIDDAKSAHKAWEWIENIYTDGKSILDSSSCNLVLVAYNKTKCAESANGVFSFLSERMNRFKAGNEATILPTVVGFSAGLGVLSSANRMDDVFSLIDEMNELSNKGVPGIKPDKGCYTSILAPLARNKSADGALYAQKLLTLMKEDSESPPTTMEFNAAINACASTSGKPPNKRKALEAAFEIFQQARESRSVDAVTYGIMMKACMKLTNDDETRLKLIEVRA